MIFYFVIEVTSVITEILLEMYSLMSVFDSLASRNELWTSSTCLSLYKNRSMYMTIIIINVENHDKTFF